MVSWSLFKNIISFDVTLFSPLVTSLGFAWVLGLNVWQSISFIFYVIFVDCIFAGIVVATFLWLVANRYLRTSNLEPDIEWGYSFDVHLNAFFPPLMLLHFIQLFFYNWLISKPWFISNFLGNTFWLLALSYYVYITFLGYNCKYISFTASQIRNIFWVVGEKSIFHFSINIWILWN